MTRAHIEVVVNMSIDEAITLQRALKKLPKGQLDVLHNQLVDALNLAEATIIGPT